MSIPSQLAVMLRAALVLQATGAAATVQLPRWFSDGMVLQASDEGGPNAFLAGRTVPPGEKVTITGDVGEYTATSDPGSGHWKVALAHSSSWKTDSAAGMAIMVQGATGPPAAARGVLAGDGDAPHHFTTSSPSPLTPPSVPAVHSLTLPLSRSLLLCRSEQHALLAAPVSQLHGGGCDAGGLPELPFFHDQPGART